MKQEQVEILRGTDNPDELVVAAQTLANSQDVADHQALSRFLVSAEFLNRLDSPAAYRGRPNHLKIARIMEVLKKNPAPSARQLLAWLTQDVHFISEPTRVDLLIKATSIIVPPPPEVIAFWDRFSQPDDGYTPLTIEALITNRSMPALELLEKKFADPRHADEEKVDWMRTYLLPVRDDLEILQASHRMLMGSLPEKLRPALIEALYDYKPQAWYPPSIPVTPPNRQAASAAVKAELLTIGTMALEQIPLSKELKGVVTETLDAIRE